MIDRIALMELLKSMSGSAKLGTKGYSWQWEIEADILTVRYYEGKASETTPIVRQWRLVPVGDGA